MSKVILVTGGSRGIGSAVARLAGARGWSAAVNYAGREDAAAETVAAVKAAGAGALAVRGDVSLEADVIAMFAAAERELGPLDGLVNNAGIVAKLSPLAEMSADRIRRMFEVNVLGSYLCAREAGRRMARSRGGRGGAIVNVSSAASRLGAPGDYVDYAGSKGAIDAFTIGLAKEVGPEGIRVNAVRPGFTETDIHAETGSPERAQAIGAMSPLGRAATPEEIAAGIVWLLSDEASYVSGAILDIAGGR